jgi:hypothetical protein
MPMDDDKYLISVRGLFENYNKDEIRELLWDMYKGWFLHNATEVDSDRMIDMLLFYDELKNLISEVPNTETIASFDESQQNSIPTPENKPSLE